jgi:hypothetical protein
MADPSVPSDASGPAGETPSSRRQTPPEPARTAAASTPAARRGWLSLRTIALVPVVLILLIAVYYVVGMIWLNRIDDDTAFGEPSSAPTGGSAAVAIAADLIEREAVDHRWLANDPFFMPGSLLDNGPNYQQGIMTALFRFTSELRDEIARTRGSSSEDPEAKAAAGYLSYPPDVWLYNPEVSWWTPATPSEKQYEQGMRSLRSYNQRVADGGAQFEARSDNLQTLIDRITSDIGSQSASIAQHIEDHAGYLLDFRADDLFYADKGRLYGYFLLMRALQADFADVIAERGMGKAWGLTLDSLREAATLQPWVVTNGSPDGQFLPSHLSAQGFYLLRARTQLKELSNILLK